MKRRVKESTRIITTRCPMCGRERDIEVDADAYRAWQDGELIQRAFPDLSADDREALKTGICPRCWDRMFAGDDEEDVEECGDQCEECGPEECIDQVVVKEYDDDYETAAAEFDKDLNDALEIAENYLLAQLGLSDPEEVGDVDRFREEVVHPVVNSFFEQLPEDEPFTEKALVEYIKQSPITADIMKNGLTGECGPEECTDQLIVKEDATDNSKSRAESLKLTADYFLGQLRGLYDKINKDDREGAQLFYKNVSITLKDLVRQFEDLKANF